VIDAERKPRRFLLRFFREFVRPYWSLQLEIALCLAVGVVLSLADPLILKAIIDRALGDGDSGMLVVLVSLLVGVLSFRVAFRILTARLTSYSGLRVLFDLRQRAFEHVLRLSPYHLRGERSGDVLARLTSDIDILYRAAAQLLASGAQDALNLVAISVTLFFLDPFLASILLLGYPPLALALWKVNQRVRVESTHARSAIANVYAYLEERLNAVRLVREFRRERAEARAHVRVSRPWIQHNVRLSVIGSVQTAFGDVMISGALALVFLLGGLRAIEGALSLGGLVAFYTLAVRLQRPVTQLIDFNVELQVARAALVRVFGLLDLEPDVREAPDALAPALVRGALRFEGVVVEREGKRVLDGVDLELAPGSVVALVGPSGAGKSTLAALIARHLDPDRGRVVLDELDLKRWKLAPLRRAVAVVPQETQLFHDTLAGNLRFARANATDDELRAALLEVELGPLLGELANGLDTTLGEQGMRLSGGERQRVALARALLDPRPVTVFDEATSALDSSTERVVLERLLARSRSRTSIVIAHRLGSLVGVDRIVVMSAGRVVESGTHRELFAKNGLYRKLWDDQLREEPPLGAVTA
jgi:ATP-binding cassette subfamily B protein